MDLQQMKKNKELNIMINKFDTLNIQNKVIAVVNKHIREILDELVKEFEYLYYEKTPSFIGSTFNRYHSNSLNLCVPQDMLVRQIMNEVCNITWHCTPHTHIPKFRVYMKVSDYTNHKVEWVFDEVFLIEEVIKYKRPFLFFGDKDVFVPFPIETMMKVYRQPIKDYLRYTIEIKEIY